MCRNGNIKLTVGNHTYATRTSLHINNESQYGDVQLRIRNPGSAKFSPEKLGLPGISYARRRSGKITVRALFSIYQLIDPTTDVPFYVGLTSQSIQERLQGHLSEAHSASRAHIAWINRLVQAGYTPYIELLREVDNSSEAHRIELDYIRQYIASGFVLTNQYGVPPGVRLSCAGVDAASEQLVYAENVRLRQENLRLQKEMKRLQDVAILLVNGRV